MHSNANVLGSHANANVWVTHLQMHLNLFKVFWLYINDSYYLEKKQRNVYKHIINLFNKYSSTLL